MSDDDAHRLVLRGAFATGAGFALKFGARLGFLILAGRLFGAAAFGSYSLGIAVVESGVGLAGLSMRKALFQLLDGREEGRTAGHVVLDATVLVLIASAIVAAAIMIGSCVAAGGLPTDGPYQALFWLAPMVAGQAVAEVLLAAGRWKHLIRYEVVGRSLVEPYTQVAVALAGWAAGWSMSALIVAYWMGNATLNAYAFVGVQRGLGSFELRTYRLQWRRLAVIVRRVASNTATDLLNGIYARVDLYIVGAVLGAGWAGIYAMAQQVATPIRQIRQSFDGLLVPLAARTVAARGATATGTALASAARLILAIQLPVILLFIAVGAKLLGLFGPAFAAGWIALIVLATAEAIHAAFGTGDLMFVYLDPRRGLRQTAFGIAVGAGTAVLLLPVLGITGAAVAMLAGYLSRAALRAWTLRRRFGVTVPLAHASGPLVAAMFGLSAVLLMRPIGDLPALAAGLATYAAVIWAWLRATGERLRLSGFEGA